MTNTANISVEEAGTSTRYLGTVKWFDDSKGWGFVIEDETQDEHFVHYKEILSCDSRNGTHSGSRKTLLEGQRVMFTKTIEERGLRATQVRVVD